MSESISISPRPTPMAYSTAASAATTSRVVKPVRNEELLSGAAGWAEVLFLVEVQLFLADVLFFAVELRDEDVLRPEDDLPEDFEDDVLEDVALDGVLPDSLDDAERPVEAFDEAFDDEPERPFGLFLPD